MIRVFHCGRQERYDVKVDWRFTTEDARIKLKRLYPVIQD